MGRYRTEGDAGLRDRSSAPHRIPHRTSPQRVEVIAALRRLRFTGPEIAEVLGMALSTVSGILARIGMGKLGRVGLEPAVRYERDRPGDLIHIDIKKLGRIDRGAGARITGMANRGSRRRRTDAAGIARQIAGWEYVHIAIDDCTRLAYAEVLPNQTASTAIAFLRRAVAFYARHGITVQQLLTDNGGAYRSTIHAIACRALGIRHLPTRAYRPQTNGKAERFIRTLTAGWAYGAVYRHSTERTAALDGWLWHYNHHRKHSALGHQPPIARLNERTNLPGTYTYARFERRRPASNGCARGRRYCSRRRSGRLATRAQRTSGPAQKGQRPPGRRALPERLAMRHWAPEEPLLWMLVWRDTGEEQLGAGRDPRGAEPDAWCPACRPLTGHFSGRPLRDTSNSVAGKPAAEQERRPQEVPWVRAVIATRRCRRAR